MKDQAAFHGRTFILVGTDVELMHEAFASLEAIQTVTYRENGHPVAAWQIVIAHDYRGDSRSNKMSNDGRQITIPPLLPAKKELHD